MIAGVCGGIGRRFDIDPVIVRIGWVLLTLVGGSGVFLYLIAWLVIAKEGEAESAVVSTLRGGQGRTIRGLLAILIVVLLILMIGSPFGWVGAPFGWFTGWGTGGGLFLPLLLIAAGVALLVWPEAERHHRSFHPAPPASPTTPQSQPQSQSQPQAEPASATSVAWKSYPPPQAPSGSQSPPAPPAPAQGAQSAQFAQPAQFTQPVQPTQFTQPPPPAQPRRRPFLGPLTMALLLVITGSAIALDRADLVDVDPAVFLALCLTVVGVVLTLSAFLGRARGLIALGVLLLPVVWGFHAVDLTWWDGIGEETHVVTSIDDLESEYHLGIGQLVVDLTDVDLAGTTQRFSAGVTIGEVVVMVPDGMHVEVEADGRIGELRIDNPGPDLADDGYDLSLITEIGDPEGGTLLLDLELGIGSARVEVQR